MIIPYKDLSDETLQLLVEDFVTRDGTDYGQAEISTQDKARRLLVSLKAGDMLISYNEETETCGLITKEELSKRNRI